MNIHSKHKKWNAPIICFVVFTIIILILFVQFCYISLSTNIYGKNMKECASKRNTVSEILTAKRGTIYDIKGNILAQNISTYTLVAYLDPSKTKDDKSPVHVVDKEYTATLEFTPPAETLAIASIASDIVEYPQKPTQEVFRAMPDDNILERLFTSNTQNANEYIVASIGLTQTSVSDLSIKLSLTGFGYVIKRVNVIPETNESENVENE